MHGARRHIPKWVHEMLKDEQSVADSADTPQNGDAPRDESPDEDPEEINPKEDLEDSGAETRPEVETRPE